MKFDVAREILIRRSAHKRKKRRHKILSVMAAFVVFCTTYALILPAITIESGTCTLEEHAHTDACYIPFAEQNWQEVNACVMAAHSRSDLIGEVDVIVHTHEDHCRDREGNLICPLDEVVLHQHTAVCCEEPPAEEPPAEEPPAEEPPAEEPLAEEPPAEEPPAEEPPAEEPPAEEPLAEEPPAEEPPAEEPPAEEPPAEEPPAEEPPAEEPPAEEPPAEEPPAEEPPAEEPPAEEPPAEEPPAEEPPAEEPPAEEPPAEEPPAEEPPAEEPPAEEPPAEEPPAEEPPAEEPAAEEPPAEEPAAEEPPAEEPPAEEPPAEEPPAEEPPAEEPPAEEPPAEEPNTTEVFYCGMQEHSLHTHTQDCLDENGEIVCETLQIIHHQHTEECLHTCTTTPDKVELICENEDDSHIHDDSCYFAWALACGKIEHTHEKACGIIAERTVTYENDRFTLSLNVTNVGSLPDDLTVDLRLLDRTEQAYAPYADHAMDSVPGELRTLSAYEIVFYSEGEELLLPDAEITAQLAMKETTIPQAEDVSPLNAEQAGELLVQAVYARSAFSYRMAPAAEEIEAEEDDSSYQLRLTALQETGGGVADADSTMVNPEDETTMVMTFALGSRRTFALAASVEPLPTFDIEYYTNILRYYEPDDSAYALKIINTASTSSSVPVAGEARMGDMPVNGKGTSASPTGNPIYMLNLETSTTSGFYRVAMRHELVEVYQKHENVLYSNAMTSAQMDALRENENYGVTELQITQAGAATPVSYVVNDSSKINDTSAVWNDVDDLYYFTNNPDAVGVKDEYGRSPIVITDGMTIRYIYYPTSGELSVDSMFYDYDISSGTTDSDSRFTLNTGKQGINSTSNYINGTGSAHLAFGNSNTGSGWQNQKVAEVTSGGKTIYNAINRYNGVAAYGDTGSYSGLTFGIVKDYVVDDDGYGHLVYNDGIIAPYLFSYNPNNTPVKGKSTYTNTDMVFRRDGDTYTLTRVEGNDGIYDNHLELFEVTYNKGSTTLLSNSFWPFDGINNGNGHDRHFGGVYNGTQTYSGIAVSYGSGSFAASGNLPASDEGDEVRNSYFGLEFEVDFHLDGSYTGPMEYLFYGDDDMWVFLTDHTTGESHLIADIGGVHSSVGSYTDLWDWVPNTAERPNGKGDYTLHFYYTERGASGSSCYMQFTIPDAVTGEIHIEETGSVEVRKEIVGGMTSDENFRFDYEVEYPSNLEEAERDRILPYSVFDEEGNLVTSGSMFRTGQFDLADGQKILIGNIPVGSVFNVSEESGTNYTTQWATVPDGATSSVDPDTGAVTVTSTVEELGQKLSFVCENTYDSLTLEKQVDLANGFAVPEQFTFGLLFEDAGGEPLSGTLTTVIRGANGTYSDPETVTLTDGTLSVSIGAGESVSFYPLPDGATFTIVETDAGGLLPTWPDGSGNEHHGDTVTGTIDAGNVTVTCINRAYYELPSTGGTGTIPYTTGGLLIIAAAILLWYKHRRKEARSSS